jgi:multiple sugar transport system substrate-binding protein
VPKTLDELMTAAKTLNDPAGNVAGFVTRGDGVQAVYTLAPFIFAYGARWLDDNGQPDLSSSAFIDGLRYYGDILRTAGPPNIVGMQWKTSYPLFQQAHAAMFTDATNFIAFFEDPEQSRIVDQVGVAPLPAGPAGTHSTLISWGPAIAASSKKKEATWLVIQYLTSKAMAVSALEATHMPPSRQSVYDSDIYTKSVPADLVAATKVEIDNAVPNGANPLVIPVPEVRSAIGTAIVAVLQGRTPNRRLTRRNRKSCKSLRGNLCGCAPSDGGASEPASTVAPAKLGAGSAARTRAYRGRRGDGLPTCLSLLHELPQMVADRLCGPSFCRGQ